MITDPELINAIQKHHLFSAMSPTEFEILCSNARICQFKTGERIMSQQQEAERFYFVTSGKVKLFRISPDGHEKVIEIVKAGETFAEAIMFMEKNHFPADGEAVGATSLVSFKFQDFMKLLSQNTTLCFRMLGSTSMRLHKRLNEIETLTLQNATHRVIRHLILQLPDPQAESAEINLDIPKRLMASRLSIQPETFSRILHKLKELKVIDVEGRRISIPNTQKLFELEEF